MENSEKSLAKAQQSQLYWTMTVTWICSITIDNIKMDKKKKKQDGARSPVRVHCVPCPKKGNKIKILMFFLNRVRV